MPLHIEIAQDSRDLVLRVAGELDVAHATELVRCIEDLTQMTLEPRIVVEASEVTFIDSTGTQALILANRRCLDAGGSLLIRSPSGPVEQILQITGLDQVLTVDAGGDD
jgi:anti-sigma B factor antagonist